MAEKHKSKYKAPKDLEKSQKIVSRKDIKDYTGDAKETGLNPKTTGEKQLNVLRKTDKEVVDTGDIYVKYNADDRLYKDLNDGEYDPKHAAKVLKKRQDKDEKDNEKNIKDSIENLTREQYEQQLRSWVRKNILKSLNEADEMETAETETPEDAVAEPEVDTVAPATAAPEKPAAPTTEPAAETPTTEPAPAEVTPEQAPEDLENKIFVDVANKLSEEGAIGKIKSISKILKLALNDVDIEDQATVYKLLRQFAIKKLSTLTVEQ